MSQPVVTSRVTPVSATVLKQVVGGLAGGVNKPGTGGGSGDPTPGG